MMITYKVRILLTEGEDNLTSISEIVKKYGMFKGITPYNLTYHFNKMVKDKTTGELVKNNEANIGGVQILKEVVK